MIQDNSDLGRLVRRIGKRDGTRIIELRQYSSSKPLSAEEALVSWLLDLPEGAAVSTAAHYALRHLEAARAGSPEVERFCRYLHQAIDAADQSPLPRRSGGRRRRQ